MTLTQLLPQTVTFDLPDGSTYKLTLTLDVDNGQTWPGHVPVSHNLASVETPSGLITGAFSPVWTAKPTPPVGGDVTTWAATTGFIPLMDKTAFTLIHPVAENRVSSNESPSGASGNGNLTELGQPNAYVPSSAELELFYTAKWSSGQTVLEFNPYSKYVTGWTDGQRTTDEIIQQMSHKWGIPTDWIRAEYVSESNWHQTQLGDDWNAGTTYSEYPAFAQVPNSTNVYSSLGITQVKWLSDNTTGPGTDPLRWKSTAFNVDYQCATIRFFYDNPDGARSSWGDSTYVTGESNPPQTQWLALGGWFSPYPWNNSGQLSYIASVQTHLAAKPWLSPDF